MTKLPGYVMAIVVLAASVQRRRDGCCFRADGDPKVVYDTKAAAQSAIDDMVRKGKLSLGEMRAYPCHCGLNPGKYHTGHDRGIRPRSRRRGKRGGRR